MTSWQPELQVAIRAAQQAGAIAQRYQVGIQAEEKADLSPVTMADKECEKLISAILSEAFPADGLLGEEGSDRKGDNGRLWIIDPIDGTRDYVRGNPFWANLIGFEVDGEIAVGVANFPSLGRMYTAVKGGGAFCNGEPMHVSTKSSLSEAVVCVNGLQKMHVAPFRNNLLDWLSQCWAVRSYGGGPDAMMIANGQADLWIEPVAAPWDLAPLKVILQEAGATFLNFDGGESIYGGNCIASTPALAGEVRKLLNLA